jgi:hypothetical protein
MTVRIMTEDRDDEYNYAFMNMILIEYNKQVEIVERHVRRHMYIYTYTCIYIYIY